MSVFKLNVNGRGAEMVVLRIAPDAAADSVARIEACFHDLVNGRTDFWSTIRDATEEEVRAIMTIALQETNGSYRTAARLFHIPPDQYRRFMDVLRRKGCIIHPAAFRRLESQGG